MAGGDDLDQQIQEFTKKHAIEIGAREPDEGDPKAEAKSGKPETEDESDDDAPDASGSADESESEESDEEDDEQAEEEEGDEDEGELSPAATLKKAQELVKRGDAKALKQAVKMALGVDLDALRINGKKWEAWRKKTRAADENLRRREQTTSHKEQQVTELARAVEQRYLPIAQAAHAYKEGDFGAFKEFVEALTGDSYEDATRAVVRAHVSKDPRQSRYEREAREARAEVQRLRQEIENKEKSATQQRVEAEYKAGLRDRLGAGKFKGAAEIPSFIEEVFRVQQEHYDRDSDTTIPDEQAAQIVVDRKRNEVSPWSNVLGLAARVADQEPDNPAESDQGGSSPAKRRKRVKPLRRNEAAAASGPGRALSDDELIAKYERLHKASGG